MEIERKFLIKKMPEHLERFDMKRIEQGYLCTNPVVRIRRSDEDYYLTYKGSGLMAREEYNLPLTREAYGHLKPKADGRIIQKCRYLIPLDGGLTLELDVFEGDLAPLVLAEVEFESEENARSFVPPDWLGEDVTFDRRYHNSAMSRSDYKL
jgi:CYTH domain-containing protein